MTPLYLCASSTAAVAAAADSSTSSMSSAPISDSTTRRPSNVIMHPPKPKKKKTHSTDPYLRDFTLVAEAARRAQMSLMMRDMENISIRPFYTNWNSFPNNTVTERGTEAQV
ncbi:hypothetical protein F5Y07DRAFT_404981 [Xylaria sp. FL0933]|nr:hypothetical protein F5Y07DRAFT_404981 [Xylaria sp. FL0933]